MTTSWRVALAIGVLWLAALYAQIFPRPRRDSAADEVPPARAAARFDCLSGLLPPLTLVSYAPAVPLDPRSDAGLRSIRSFHFAQYWPDPA